MYWTAPNLHTDLRIRCARASHAQRCTPLHPACCPLCFSLVLRLRLIVHTHFSDVIPDVYAPVVAAPASYRVSPVTDDGCLTLPHHARYAVSSLLPLQDGQQTPHTRHLHALHPARTAYTFTALPAYHCCLHRDPPFIHTFTPPIPTCSRAFYLRIPHRHAVLRLRTNMPSVISVPSGGTQPLCRSLRVPSSR